MSVPVTVEGTTFWLLFIVGGLIFLAVGVAGVLWQHKLGTIPRSLFMGLGAILLVMGSVQGWSETRPPPLPTATATAAPPTDTAVPPTTTPTHTPVPPADPSPTPTTAPIFGSCSAEPINPFDDMPATLEEGRWYVVLTYDNTSTPAVQRVEAQPGPGTVSANARGGQRAWACTSEGVAFSEALRTARGVKAGNPSLLVFGPDGAEIP